VSAYIYYPDKVYLFYWFHHSTYLFTYLSS